MAHTPAAHRMTISLSDDAYTAARLVASRRAAGSVSLVLEELLEVCFSRPDPARRVTITLHFNPAYWPKDRWQKILEGLGAAAIEPDTKVDHSLGHGRNFLARAADEKPHTIQELANHVDDVDRVFGGLQSRLRALAKSMGDTLNDANRQDAPVTRLMVAQWIKDLKKIQGAKG